ncbi:type IV secretion system protein [Achromobacter aegrifaciens]|uniref:type IV secretion system protein n=1 Tax=Achromobacter aegrifaciens TaxID=1287736 RepID=UPI0027B9CB6D|nr:type IV secretion system protein [Achromobacter aegrifaciens]WLW63617.1 type IV secretion system protein [Achromobacter aegrifaciens]
MATGAVQLTSLGGIARWMDASVTKMLEGVVAPMVSNATAAIWPFVTAGMAITLMWYGWLIATGAVSTPIYTALRRVVNIAIIASIAGAGGLYQTEIVGAMLDLPSDITSALTRSASTPAELLDEAANNGAEIGTRITDRSPNSVTSPARAFAFMIVSVIITVISALLTAAGIIVLVAVKAGMGLVVVVGPLFILALLFEETKGYFKNWLGQAFYYALYAALFTVLFSIIIGMFGMLQQGLLDTTQSDEINIFSMLTAIVIFISGAVFMLSQVSTITRQITGGAGTGMAIPFVGRIG